MNVKTILVSTVAVASVGTMAQSCMAVATSGIGLSIIKRVLLSGVTNGIRIFQNPNSVLGNQLIEQAMPSQLRSINNMLERVAPNVVQQEKNYIAQAAAYTATVAEPILVNAINSLDANDVTRISNGQPGTATQILKEKTATQLVAAIAPRVDQELNQHGLSRTINSVLQGGNLLGGLFGGNSNNQTNTANPPASGLSQMITQQLVNGMFNIVENHEKQNAQQINQYLGK